MAKLIPDVSPESIENNGELLFYGAAAELPDDYTVLYSYKYRSFESEQDSIEDIYVGSSRARYLLDIFHHKDWQFPNAG